jgi:hypothetical protein
MKVPLWLCATAAGGTGALHMVRALQAFGQLPQLRQAVGEETDRSFTLVSPLAQKGLVPASQGMQQWEQGGRTR